MVILITGATHSGKTRLAQTLLETYHYPYLSQDHIKMGLIRSHNTELTPEDDDKLTDYLWPITREIVKTAIENGQNLIVEGCYMPFQWREDFSDSYLAQIRFICICISQEYIDRHFADIQKYACCIEKRLEDSYCTASLLKQENERFRHGCENFGLPCITIEEDYLNEIKKSELI